MNILLTCLSFANKTGSELYFYDLACGLKTLGHEVSILSNLTGGTLYKRATKRGIKCFAITHAPSELKPDVILASHRTVIAALLKYKLYTAVPIVQICHSEIIPEEYPMVDERVIHYIAIRPSIAKLLEDNYYIDPSQISLIWNPINVARLTSVKSTQPKNQKNVLFPGTIDYLRKSAFLNMYDRAVSEGFHMTVVGHKYMDYLDNLDPNVITVDPVTDNMGEYYAKATHTAGIMLGRTTIEGWLFGLPAYIYIVDSMGVIQTMEEQATPPVDLIYFDHINVATVVTNRLNSLLNVNPVN